MSALSLEEKDLELREIRTTNDRRPKNLHEKLPFSFCWYMCGPPASGKTNLLMNLIKGSDFYRGKFHNIYIFSPSLGSLSDPLPLPEESIFHFYDEEALEEIMKNANPKERSLYIFDDVITELRGSKPLTTLIRNRRHKFNASIIIASQKYKALETSMRVSCDVLSIFGRAQNLEFQGAYEEFVSLHRDVWNDMVMFCRQDPYGFLTINNQPSSTKRYLFKFQAFKLPEH